MKKILLLAVLLLTGCNDLSNTPTKQTEAFLKKYQALDNEVIIDLNNVLLEENMTETQKDSYKTIMKKHYQNLAYEIKNETIDGDDAVVTVEITVTDFNKILNDSRLYLSSHMEEFYDESGNYDISKYTDYRLEQLKNAKDKVKYTINISLTKVNDNWRVDKQTQQVYDKINGVYNY